jgi:hypothetical protein
MTRIERNLLFTSWAISLLLAAAIVLFNWSVALLFVVPVFGFPFFSLLLEWLDGVYERRREARKSSPPAHFAAVPRNR